MRDLTPQAGAAWAALTPLPATEQRFNPNHSATGQFSSSPGQAAGQTRNTQKKAAQNKRQLLQEASADRQKAHQLEQQLRQIEHQLHAVAAAQKQAHVNPAKSAAAKKAAAHRHPASTHRTKKTAGGGKTLQQQAAHLKTEISGLLSKAKALDAQAAKL